MNKEIKLLNISDRIYNKYKRLVKGNKELDKLTVQKKLTRDFILGEEKCSDYNNRYITRNYGKLYILVDMNEYCVIDIQNRKGKPKSIFINPREKQDLNKLLGLED